MKAKEMKDERPPPLSLSPRGFTLPRQLLMAETRNLQGRKEAQGTLEEVTWAWAHPRGF